MNEDLTIIIATRDRLWSLPQAVESCRSFGLRLQVIVVDDGSTDGTDEWLSAQPLVESIRLDGWGKPFAINRALPLARGEFIRFLDSDDWFPDGTLLEHVALARESSADLVVAGYVECSERGEQVAEHPWIQCDDFISQQLGECDGSHYSAFTFRRSFIEDIPHRSNFPAPKFATRDDRCLMLEVALRCPKIVEARTPGLCHRHHKKDRLQKTRGFGTDAANLNLLLIYMKILRELEERGELTPRRAKAAVNVLDPLAEWMSDRQLHTALELLAGTRELAGRGSRESKSAVHLLERVIGRPNYYRARYLRRSILNLLGSVHREGIRKPFDWLK